MRVFGNIMNRIAETIPPVKPEVGMGATVLMFSDRHAATIVSVETPKCIIIQHDIATRTDKNGLSEDQSYTFAPNRNANPETYTLRKNGTWVKEGESMSQGTILRIGTRDEYRDPSF